MAGSLALSRVLGILRDTAMTAKFGIGPHTDAYRLAFAIPDLIFFLVAGGALSTAFIPIFSSFIHTEREDDAWELFNVVVTVMSIAVIAMIGLAWIFAPWLIEHFAAGKPHELFPLIVRMARIVLPAQYAFFIGGLLIGTLYARQRFLLPGLAPNIYNVGIIFGALVLSAFVSPGIVGMSWGALVGAILGSLILPLWGVYRLGGRYRPSLNLKAPGVGSVFKLMLPVVLGLSLPAVYGLIMQSLGSFYAAGINTALDLSNKLMQAPLGVFGQSLALAAFPALSQFFAQKRMDMFRDQLASSMRTVLYLSLPATALLAALSGPIVRVAFGYGHTAPSDLNPTAHCLQVFSIGICAWCLHPVLMRSFYAMHKSAMPIIIGTLTTFVFVGLYFVLRPLFPPDANGDSTGYLAMPLSGSLAAILMVFGLGALAYKDAGGFDVKSVLVTFLKGSVAAALCGVFGYFTFKFSPHENRWGTIFIFLIIFSLSGWVYYFVTKWLGMPETAYVAKAFKRVKRPAPGP